MLRSRHLVLASTMLAILAAVSCSMTPRLAPRPHAIEMPGYPGADVTLLERRKIFDGFDLINIEFSTKDAPARVFQYYRDTLGASGRWSVTSATDTTLGIWEASYEPCYTFSIGVDPSGDDRYHYYAKLRPDTCAGY